MAQGMALGACAKDGLDMIRYIHIGDQIIDGDDSFAFYDTVLDIFVDIAGDQVFDSREDLVGAVKARDFGPAVGGSGVRYDVNRLLSLIPEGTT